MNWGSVGRGFTSVADDIARSQMGKRIADGILDEGVNLAAKTSGITADDAMNIMAKAQVESDDFYRNFVARNGVTPDDANDYLYRLGRGAAHTGNFARNNAGHAINLGMTGMMFAPMAMQILPQSQEQQYG